MSALINNTTQNTSAPSALEEIALDIARAEQARLVASFKHLSPALLRLELTTHDNLAQPMATDGAVLAINPLALVQEYRAGENEVARDIVHAVLHCLLGHPFPRAVEDPEAWHAACDIVVEAAALDICRGRYSCEHDDIRHELATRIEQTCGPLVPQRLYRAIVQLEEGAGPLAQAGFSLDDMAGIAAAFLRDSHAAWRFLVQQQNTGTAAGGGAGAQQPNNAEQQPTPDSPDSTPTGSGADDPHDFGQTERQWKAARDTVAAAMSADAYAAGAVEGALAANLVIRPRYRNDLATYIRRLCAPAEHVHPNTEEFDYIPYVFGLSRYGNLPLIEPLEYREDETLDDFFIALDTSGSCEGELVAAFARRTFELIESSAGDAAFHVHVLQCDQKLQSHDTITSKQDMEALASNFTVRGFGGTDFRPVFDYIEDLLHTRRITRVRGLLYFTDGLGIYPPTPPSWPVAFAFTQAGEAVRQVPPWAERIIITEHELKTHVKE